MVWPAPGAYYINSLNCYEAFIVVENAHTPLALCQGCVKRIVVFLFFVFYILLMPAASYVPLSEEALPCVQRRATVRIILVCLANRCVFVRSDLQRPTLIFHVHDISHHLIP